MWHTANGKRTLAGAEARLIRETAWDLVDAIRAEISLDSSVQFGILLFDQLTWQQQLVMLFKVLKPLLDSSVGSPTATALLDATIAAIYAQMNSGVECEIDMEQTSPQGEEGDTELRQRIIEAIREHGAEGNWPDPECVVMDAWELTIDAVQGWVLADEDWQMDGLTLDLPPDKNREFKQALGIRDDYFTDIPPDANDQQARAAWANILELINGQRPDEAVFD
ncbi:MAG: hypothetical protein ACE1ZA_15075 [Pseudomonadales bacterium]